MSDACLYTGRPRPVKSGTPAEATGVLALRRSKSSFPIESVLWPEDPEKGLGEEKPSVTGLRRWQLVTRTCPLDVVLAPRQVYFKSNIRHLRVVARVDPADAILADDDQAILEIAVPVRVQKGQQHIQDPIRG